MKRHSWNYLERWLIQNNYSLADLMRAYRRAGFKPCLDVILADRAGTWAYYLSVS